MTKADIIAAIKEKLTALLAIAKHDTDVDTVTAAGTDADDLTTANGGTAEDADPSPNLTALHDHLDAMLNEGDRRHDSQHLADLRTLMESACADEPPPAPPG